MIGLSLKRYTTSYIKYLPDKVMRVGVLTLPFNNNYGGYLQAYALMTVLKGLGHDVTLIYRRHNKRHISPSKRIKYSVKQIVKAILGRQDGPLLLTVESRFRWDGRNMMRFLDHKISPKSPAIYTPTKLKKYCKGRFDAIVVGSDQVWRPDYVPNIENYFLDFSDGWNIRRIAYAASFGGKPTYSPLQRQVCGESLSHFNAISLREKGGADYCNEFGWQNQYQVVLDPTLLIDRKVYQNISSPSEEQPYLYVYLLDRNTSTLDEANCASKISGLRTYDIYNPRVDKVRPSIEKWLGGFTNAGFVITDSFHGMAFSIIFNKPFAVIVNEGRGADRFYSLLSSLSLENRVISANNSIKDIFAAPVNWKNVNTKLLKMREQSVEFLRNALN